jgi:Tfp pilus assembly protein PilN
MRAVNLIPSDQRSGGTVGARSGGAVFLVLGLLVGLVVLAALYGSSHHQLQSRRAEAATLDTRAQQVQAQAQALAPYASFMALREQRLHSIAQLIGGRFDWSNVMGELSRVLPSDISLSTLTGTVGPASASTSTKAPAPAAASASTSAASPVSSATPPGATPSFTLGGCAASQAVVAQMLVRLRLISGVSSVALQSSTKPGGGGSSSSTSSGPCPGNAPVFSVVVAFEPLPTTPTPSIQALTASAPAAAGGSKRTAAAQSLGGSR